MWKCKPALICHVAGETWLRFNIAFAKGTHFSTVIFLCFYFLCYDLMPSRLVHIKE